MTSSADNEERDFLEFRRKVRAAEVLSAAMARLVRGITFTGQISIVVQNGRVLKSGHEEGYFRNQQANSGLFLRTHGADGRRRLKTASLTKYSGRSS